MLKNTKVLKNNNKIIRGIHTESYLYFENVNSGSIGIVTNGITESGRSWDMTDTGIYNTEYTLPNHMLIHPLMY